VGEIEGFIRKLEDEFEDIPKGTMLPDSPISDFIEINSLNILVISTIYEFEYNKVVEFEKIKKAETIQDLYNLLN